MRITINETACIGAGLCVLEADDVFDQRDEDGVVVVLDKNPDPGRHQAIRTAALACPVLAITIEENG